MWTYVDVSFTAPLVDQCWGSCNPGLANSCIQGYTCRFVGDQSLCCRNSAAAAPAPMPSPSVFAASQPSQQSSSNQCWGTCNPSSPNSCISGYTCRYIGGQSYCCRNTGSSSSFAAPAPAPAQFQSPNTWSGSQSFQQAPDRSLSPLLSLSYWSFDASLFQANAGEPATLDLRTAVFKAIHADTLETKLCVAGTPPLHHQTNRSSKHLHQASPLGSRSNSLLTRVSRVLGGGAGVGGVRKGVESVSVAFFVCYLGSQDSVSVPTADPERAAMH